jgi:hypothetical protein
MPFYVWSALLTISYFLVILALVEVGRRRGAARLQLDPKHGLAGTGAVEGPVLGLYGLLIAFSFGGAMERFNERKNLVIEEGHIVSTAWHRLDILPPAEQPAIRDVFRSYLAERFATFRISGEDETQEYQTRVRALQKDLWDRVIAVYRRDGFTSSGNFVLSALNDMFEIGDKRINFRRLHTPRAIFMLLYGLGLVASLMAGMGLAAAKNRNWLYAVGFALINALSLYFIIDIEHPRQGLIRIDDIDRVLDDLMKRIG